MHQGVLVGLGSIDEVFHDPWHPYVRGLAAALHPGEATAAPSGDAADDHTDAALGT
jgi:ABC-type oligopeptide transport system ATPase subunit